MGFRDYVIIFIVQANKRYTSGIKQIIRRKLNATHMYQQFRKNFRVLQKNLCIFITR